MPARQEVCDISSREHELQKFRSRESALQLRSLVHRTHLLTFTTLLSFEFPKESDVTRTVLLIPPVRDRTDLLLPAQGVLFQNQAEGQCTCLDADRALHCAQMRRTYDLPFPSASPGPKSLVGDPGYQCCSG